MNDIEQRAKTMAEYMENNQVGNALTRPKRIPATPGELKFGEPHPAAYKAKEWIAEQDPEDLFMWQESFASCAIEGNRLAEICSETLNRLMTAQPVSDRYVLGLAWTMRFGEMPKKLVKKKGKKK